MDTVLEDLLQWPQSKVIDLQNSRLREIISRCYRGHPYYRELMQSEGLKPRDIETIDDLEKFPVTRKSDFVASPERFRLESDDLSIEEQALYRIIYTTGSTTGVPAPVYVTAADHFDYMLRSARRRDFIDIRAGDIIVSLFPLTPYPMGAYGRSSAEAAACGAALVEANPGRPSQSVSPHRSTAEVASVVFEHQPQILWGIPSYVLRFLRYVADTGNNLHRLRLVMVTGEGLSPKMRLDISKAMEAVGSADNQVVNRYGSTEQGSSMVECAPGSGFHDLAPDALYMEVLDPETGKRCADGEEGELAFTHLNHTGTVLIRFAVGDRAVMTREPCPYCGRMGSARLIAGPSRSGDIIKIKGTLVNLAALSEQLAEVDGVRESQLIVAREEDQDSLLLRLATQEDAVREAVDVAAEAKQLVQRAANITPAAKSRQTKLTVTS